MSVILITTLFYKGFMLKGEIGCLSLLGPRVLKLHFKLYNNNNLYCVLDTKVTLKGKSCEKKRESTATKK